MPMCFIQNSKKVMQMKILSKIYSLITLIILLFVSCEDKTEITYGYINGYIEDYEPTIFDSVCCFDYKIDSATSAYTNFHKVGKIDVNSTGYFSAVLSEPLNKHAILSRIERVFSISDSTVHIGYLRLQAYKYGNPIGYIIKCTDDFYYKQGLNNYSTMIYVDKAVTINGTFYPNRNSMTYNLDLKKGWNEVINTYSFILQSDNKYNINILVSNTTTENLKWRFIKYN